MRDETIPGNGRVPEWNARFRVKRRGAAHTLQRVRAGPSHRHARRAAGDRGPWVSLPLRATIPEGNTVGQHADVDVGLSDGLGPQKDPNSGRTRVQSGPAGPHRPTTRRGSAIVQSRRQPDQRRPHRETSAHRLRRRWTSASRRRGHRRIDAGDIDAGETSAHRLEGEADPLLVVTEECLARRGCGPARAIVTPDAPPAIAARGSACP